MQISLSGMQETTLLYDRQRSIIIQISISHLCANYILHIINELYTFLHSDGRDVRIYIE